MKNRIFVLILIILLAGCERSHHKEVEIISSADKTKYFIELKSFGKKDNAISFAEKVHIANEERLHLFADTAGKLTYKVCIGPFPSSYSASENAFKLFLDKTINDYTITQNFLPVYDEFANLVFVGSNKGIPSLYRYNMRIKSSELLWSKQGERVIELAAAKDNNVAFFLTVKSTGRKGIFPFVNGIELFQILLSSGKVEKLQSLGDAIQIFTDWENPNSFKIIINSFDKKISTYVNQQTIIINTGGRILSNISQTFDLVKENYPQLPKHSIQSNSPDKNYFLVDSLVDTKYDYYIKGNSKKYFVLAVKQKLENIYWIDDNYLVFSTSDISPTNKSIFTESPQTSTLTIYDLKGKEIISHWEKDGEKNFILKSDFLFFDDGFGRKSKIIVYDISNRKVIDIITNNGGCGIKNIPFFPRFN